MNILKLLVGIILLTLLTSCTGKANTKIEELDEKIEDIERISTLREQELEDTRILLDNLIVENIDLTEELDEERQKNIEIESKNKETNRELETLKSTRRDEEFMLVSMGKGSFEYVYTLDDGSYQDLTIIGDDRDPVMEHFNVERVQLGDKEGGLLSITIVGSIYNLKLEEFEFNEDFSEKENIVLIDQIDEIRNSVVEVYSYFPEGIPFEMLSWENPRGEKHSYLIGDDGYGFGGFVLFE